MIKPIILGVVGVIGGVIALQSRNANASQNTNEVNNMYKTSDNMVDLIQELEGFASVPYKDGRNHTSIGYGHQIKPGEILALIGKPQALLLLAEDIRIFEKCITTSVVVSLNQNQFDALVSLVFNIGCSAFRKSTLLGLLNNGDYHGAHAQFNVWVKSTRDDGVKIVLPSLVARRETEADIFNREV